MKKTASNGSTATRVIQGLMRAMMATAKTKKRAWPIICGSQVGKSAKSPTSRSRRWMASPDSTGIGRAAGLARTLAMKLTRISTPLALRTSQPPHS